MTSPSFHSKLRNVQKTFQNGDLEQAWLLIKKLVLLFPNHYQSENLYGIIAATKANYSEAIEHFYLATKVTNQIPLLNDLYINIAKCHQLLGELAQAISVYQNNNLRQAKQLDSWYGLAQCYTMLGKKDLAISAYTKVLDLSDIQITPQVKATAYLAISETSDKLSDPNADYCINFLACLDIDIKLCDDNNALASLFFAAANIKEKQALFDQAFENFKSGNMIKSQLLNYHHEIVSQQAKICINFFNKTFVEKCSLPKEPIQQPIFIVGLPRSNTTLIESLLSCSPNTIAVGESNLIIKIIGRINSKGGYPVSLQNFTTTELVEMREYYLNTISTQSNLISIDKLPANFWNIGLIKILFPNAKIIHCIKDPVDACVSLFRQNFSEGHAYSYSLKDSADYYDLHLELIEHWIKVFPNQIFQLNYKAFLKNYRNTSIKLFNYCDLKWNDNYLQLFKHRNSVNTASSFQIRDDINSQSLQRWKQYKTHITTLLKRYKIPII